MKKRPLILGHRGYRGKYPENTMLSFGKAFEYGADGIECDIQKTADDVYIVFHDDELSRITGHKGFVCDTRFVTIKKLNAGKGEIIPDMDFFLGSLPRDKEINIELKEETVFHDDFNAINASITQSGIKDNVLISSFHHDLLPQYRAVGYRTGLLFETESIQNKKISAIRKVLKYRPFSVNLPVNVFCSDVSPRARLFLLIMKVLGVKTVYWTVNTEEQYNAVKGNAYAVITDNVELMISLRDRK